MSNNQQGFPAPNVPFSASDGSPHPVWYQYLNSIFNRTGGPSGATGDDSSLIAYLALIQASSQAGTSASGAVATSGPTSPAAPNSTAAFTMQGLAGAITPLTTGNVLVSIAGTFVSSAALVDQGISIQGSSGTGTAPTSNAALAGTQAGAVQTWTNLVAATAAADINVPFSVSFLVTGAKAGTPLWLDLAAKAITTASVFSCAGVVINAVEI